MDNTKPKLLITGNCGFIFSHVTDYFLSKGWEVIGIDDLTTGSHPELIPIWKLNPLFKFYQMDVSDINVQDIIIQEEPDYIIHGDDWTGDAYLKQMGMTQEFLDENEIKLAYVPYTKSISTSDIIKRLK